MTTPATCTATGVKTYTCSVCGGTKTEVIPALNHDYGAWTKLNDTQHQRVCSHDSNHVEKANHTWDSGEVTTPATKTQTGTRTYTCSVCGATKTEAVSAVASGKCGDSLNWLLENNGVLTISGTGAMASYTSEASAPWASYAGQITSVVVENGVTGIGSNAFRNCSNLTDVTIPNSVTDIGAYAFYGCGSLISVTTSADQQSDLDGRESGELSTSGSAAGIGQYAFANCGSLANVAIPEGITGIGDSAFSGCSNLTSVSIPESIESIGSGAFNNCSSLTNVYYAGTQAQWNAISIEGDALNGVNKAYEHSHQHTQTKVIAPTCTEKGYTQHLCVCGDSYKSDYTDALNHDYGAWTKLNDTQHQRVCKHDSSHVETEDHSWNDGEVTTPATCTAIVTWFNISLLTMHNFCVFD